LTAFINDRLAQALKRASPTWHLDIQT